jgi:hypothetical protein
MEDQLSGKGVFIRKDTGEMIDLGDVTISELHISESPLNGRVGDGERFELHTPSCLGEQKTYTFKVKVRSKRKLRKATYALFRPFRHLPRKYISKREVIDIIFKQYVDTGIVQALQPREYYMGFSRKKLQNMYRDVSWFACVHSEEYNSSTPPDPEGHTGDEYFGDPMKKVYQNPPQGFEKGGE